VIIHRVVAHEDPPFRPNIPSMEMKPEYIDLMVDCWDDEPEERPHFYRIVERLKKISGRYRGSLRRREGWDIRKIGFRESLLGWARLYTILTEKETFYNSLP